MNKYDGGIGTATDLLQHYMRTAWEAADLSWNEDNDAEMVALAECLVAEAETRRQPSERTTED